MDNDKKKHEGFFDSIKALEKELGERDILTKRDIEIIELRAKCRRLANEVEDARKQKDFALQNLKEKLTKAEEMQEKLYALERVKQ